MPDNETDRIVERYETAAAELTAAAEHLRTSAQHARNRDGGRVGAHGFAAYGHLVRAQQLLTELASEHAARSRP